MRLWLASIIAPKGYVVTPYTPNSKMLRAAAKSMSPAEREGKPWVSNSKKHMIRYQAMLDATPRPTGG